MHGSAAEMQRRKLSPDALAICHMIDAEIEREVPPPMTAETPIYRDGLYAGMRRVLTMIERGESA